MFELKSLSIGAVDSARRKAVRYRLLNEPRLAESICRDILVQVPGDREALITLVLSLSDQFGTRGTAPFGESLELVKQLSDEYERHYYAGIVCERRAIGQLRMAGPATGHIAYDWFRQAMDHFEAAEPMSPEGNEDAVLRWNTCARIINTRDDVCPAPDTGVESMLG